VAEKPYSVEAAARQIIEQCRRDIEAALVQIEAARAILKASRWLTERWEASRRTDAVTGGIHLPAYDEMRASGFVPIEEPPQPRRGRRRRRPTRFSAQDRRSAGAP
jgi:hypothetical protein